MSMRFENHDPGHGHAAALDYHWKPGGIRPLRPRNPRFSITPM
jgi:hypothetical protein